MRIALLSTSDTDLLSARASGADYVWPTRPGPATSRWPRRSRAATSSSAGILGSPQDLCSGFARIRATGMPMVVLGGEQQPSAELMELSSVPIGVAAEAHRYLAEGGPANLGAAARVPLRHGAADRRGLRAAGRDPGVGLRCERSTRGSERAQPASRSHRGSACSSTGRTRPAGTPPSRTPSPTRSTPPARRSAYRSSASSLRAAPDDLYDALGTLDALIVTVLAAGGSGRRPRAPGGDDEAWDVARMAALDIPILQGLCLTSSRAEWEASDDGVTPLDSATQIAIPEFDGRIITAPFSFKEIDAGRAAALRRRPRAVRPGRRDRGQPRPAAARARRRASARSR